MHRLASKSVQRWRVTQIGGNRAREICELEAKDAATAVRRAIREYGIDDPHRQRRLVAQRVVIG